MLEFEYNLVGYPFNKFLHDQAQFFWSLGQTAAKNKPYIEIINFVMSTLTYTVLKTQSQQEEEGAQQLGQLSHTARTPQPRDLDSLFNF